MGRVEAWAHIARPPQEVWDFFNDTSRWHEWVDFTDEVLDSSGPLAEGATYRERSRIGPIRQTSRWRITAFEPPRRQVHEGRVGLLRPRLTVLLEPWSGGTRLILATEFALPGPLRPLERVPGHQIRRGLGRTVAAAKRVLEAEASSPGPAAAPAG